jgi:acetate kinase
VDLARRSPTAVISMDGSRVTILFIRTDEELMIAGSVLRSCPAVTAELKETV